MADQSDAEQIILDHFEEIRDAGISIGAKSKIYLRLAEAYAWLQRPDQPHGSPSTSGD